MARSCGAQVSKSHLPAETRRQLANRCSFPSPLHISEYVGLLDACGFDVL
jgi:hypothetical protein